MLPEVVLYRNNVASKKWASEGIQEVPAIGKIDGCKARPETGRLRDPGPEEGGVRAADIAMHLGVTARHVRRLWAEYLGTGRAHVQRKAGRPREGPTAAQVRAVLAEHDAYGKGAIQTAEGVRAKCHTSYYDTYRIMRRQDASRRQRPDRANARGSASRGVIPVPCGTSTGTP